MRDEGFLRMAEEYSEEKIRPDPAYDQVNRG